MRWAGLAVLAGCAYHPGVAPSGAARDAGPPDALACTADSLGCPLGMTAAVTCNGACWASCTARGDEHTAASACLAWGGRLAPLQTIADQTCVHQVVFPGAASWIGFEQAPGATTLA